MESNDHFGRAKNLNFYSINLLHYTNRSSKIAASKSPVNTSLRIEETHKPARSSDRNEADKRGPRIVEVILYLFGQVPCMKNIVN